jgi:EAL domain-containing protein (putative c-di-GMP-specific phosphodiesterase class I)
VFRLILVYAGGLSSILAGLDEESGRKIIREFSASLRGITDLTVFRISEEVFAILQDEINEVVTQELMINLRTEAMSALRYDRRQYYLNLHACVSDLPKDIRTMEDLEITAALLKEAGSLNKGGKLMIRDLDVEKEKKMREEVHTLSKALQENRMEVWYQPIMNTETGKFDCAEALIRMKAADGSYVPPGRFIPAAERSGLIIRIGRFVIQEVCAFLAGKEREELGVSYIEANLSVEECIQETLPAMLKNTLEEYQVSPKLLNIEVTETADDTVSELMMHNMTLIHEDIGIELSLDDFGTGYSNLARVLNMPVGVVKFDRSMLLKAFETEEGRIVFTRLAEAVHNIDRKIVSEGVETKEQADFVTSLGIEYIQGFYYAKPMPKEAYLEFLRAHNGAAS